MHLESLKQLNPRGKSAVLHGDPCKLALLALKIDNSPLTKGGDRHVIFDFIYDRSEYIYSLNISSYVIDIDKGILILKGISESSNFKGLSEYLKIFENISSEFISNCVHNSGNRSMFIYRHVSTLTDEVESKTIHRDYDKDLIESNFNGLGLYYFLKSYIPKENELD
jgi:hypothetical protein